MTVNEKMWLCLMILNFVSSTEQTISGRHGRSLISYLIGLLAGVCFILWK